jgi:hypothetical protein
MFGLDTFKHLLPKARAWSLTKDKALRRFFEGLAGEPLAARKSLDNIFDDHYPAYTRELAAYEQQFALPASSLTDPQRRDRLAAAWKALGGQSPRYIQDILQAAGFDVYVHEWFEPKKSYFAMCGEAAAESGEALISCGAYYLEPDGGGSVNNDFAPVARDPFNYIDDGTTGLPFLMFDGGSDAQDGDTVSQDGATSTPPGYLLVNKLVEPFQSIIGDGSAGMSDGEAEAQDGGLIRAYVPKSYVIPADPTKYPYFLYIGGATFPDQAVVPNSRRDEFEYLCLKICPTEQWQGILVNYS